MILKNLPGYLTLSTLLMLPCIENASDIRKIDFRYEVKLSDFPLNAKEARVWIPLPSSGPNQTVSNLKLESPWSIELKQETEYGNRYAYAWTKELSEKDVTLAVSFTVERRALSPSEGPLDKNPGNLRRFLKRDKLVPLNGPIREEANALAKAAGSKEALPRFLYDRVVESMDYDKSGEGWGQGDALRACDVRTGNCTDFHSFFIGMARSQKIPARFVMGVPVPTGKSGEIPGYHCWAEYWVDGEGWHSVDTSEASKNLKKKDFFFGGLDSNRIEFSQGRDIKLTPLPNEGRVNYFIYPVVEVDGRKFASVKTTFHYQ